VSAPPPLRAVVFDYGHTLLDVRWDEDARRRGELRLLRELGDPVSPERLRPVLERRIGEAEAAREHAEIDYPAVLAAALADLDVPADAGTIAAAIRAEVLGGEPRVLHPRALPLLAELRELGLRLGVLSNTPDPPDLVLGLIAADGVAARVDAVVLSSQVGVRKPAPAIYLEVLRRLEVAPAEALSVGDRVAQDVAGPRAVGMHTCLATWFRDDPGDHGLADCVATAPDDVVAIVRSLV
jgi:putative hydrolase of the HAD superfamily